MHARPGGLSARARSELGVFVVELRELARRHVVQLGHFGVGGGHARVGVVRGHAVGPRGAHAVDVAVESASCSAEESVLRPVSPLSSPGVEGAGAEATIRTPACEGPASAS